MSSSSAHSIDLCCEPGSNDSRHCMIQHGLGQLDRLCTHIVSSIHTQVTSAEQACNWLLWFTQLNCTSSDDQTNECTSPPCDSSLLSASLVTLHQGPPLTGFPHFSTHASSWPQRWLKDLNHWWSPQAHLSTLCPNLHDKSAKSAIIGEFFSS